MVKKKLCKPLPWVNSCTCKIFTNNIVCKNKNYKQPKCLSTTERINKLQNNFIQLNLFIHENELTIVTSTNTG